MKKLTAFFGSLGLMLISSPLTVLAAGTESAESAMSVPLWMCVPFAGLLLCIAVLPLVKAEWWESHQPHAVLFWSLLFAVPFALKFGAGTASETILECLVNDYLTFIVLLFGLFCVSGNITMSGDLAGSPRVNVGLLALGTLLSSWIGTTGASMLMVLYFPGVQYRRMPDSNRRSASSDGLYEGSSVFLEPSFNSDSAGEYGGSADHLLFY